MAPSKVYCELERAFAGSELLSNSSSSGPPYIGRGRAGAGAAGAGLALGAATSETREDMSESKVSENSVS